MPRLLINKVFYNISTRCIFIAILGPQSSGKSTLLNAMFGCNFAIAEGRCTKGVYGTFFRFPKDKVGLGP
jgi:ABC-type phosphate/phosphonate transport system ATPase subunit